MNPSQTQIMARVLRREGHDGLALGATGVLAGDERGTQSAMRTRIDAARARALLRAGGYSPSINQIMTTKELFGGFAARSIINPHENSIVIDREGAKDAKNGREGIQSFFSSRFSFARFAPSRLVFDLTKQIEPRLPD